MTRVISISAIALSLSVVAVGAGNAQSRDFDGDLALFGRYVDALARQARIPGLSSAIIRERQVVSLHEYGFQDIDARVAVRPDTLYDIASLTKTFTSTLLMQCVERGTLTLDDPIRRYTPAIPETNATVRHVLSHTSHGTPGAEYRYDGNRYAALTDVVAACHGRPFRQALTVEILDRVAMTGSVPGHDLERPSTTLAALFDAPTLARYASAIGRLATPYTTTGSGIARADYPPRDISASAGLLSSVVDLAKYDAAIDAHIFIAAETQQLAWASAVSTTTGKRLPYGLGWFVQQYNGTRVIWHYGLWPQYSGLYLKVPDRQLTLIILGTSGGVSELFDLAAGDVTASPFARAFLRLFVS
jgi:CubicO group peptidase (beta-lactamase class C family)